MRAEIQKVLNNLYHADTVDVEQLNLLVSYIESLEYKAKSMEKTVAKLMKIMEYEMMPIEFIHKRINFNDTIGADTDQLRTLLGDYMDGKGKDN